MQAAGQETGLHDLPALKYLQLQCKAHKMGRSPEPQGMVVSKAQKRGICLH